MQFKKSELWLLLTPVTIGGAFVAASVGRQVVSAASEWREYGGHRPNQILWAKATARATDASFSSIEWSPDSSRFATYTENSRTTKSKTSTAVRWQSIGGVVEVWEAKTGRSLFTKDTKAFAADFSDDSRKLRLYGMSEYHELDASSGRPVSRPGKYSSRPSQRKVVGWRDDKTWDLYPSDGDKYHLKGRRLDKIVQLGATGPNRQDGKPIAVSEFWIYAEQVGKKKQNRRFKIATMSPDLAKGLFDQDMKLTISCDASRLYFSSRGEAGARADVSDSQRWHAMWDMGTGKPLWKVNIPTDKSQYVAFDAAVSPDNKYLAYELWDTSSLTSTEHLIEVLDAQTARILVSIPINYRSSNEWTRAQHRLNFSPDSQELARIDGDRIEIWDIAKLR